MKRKKGRRRLLLFGAIGLLAITGIADAVRYLQPAKEPRIPVRTFVSDTLAHASKLVLAYNANGGIFPGLVDVVWKEASPKTYPCNLCLHAFERFGPKEAWKDYLASLPYRVETFHKDAFKRKYDFDGPFPAVFLGTDSAVKMIVPAAEINTARSLQDLIAMMNRSLKFRAARLP